MERMPAGADTSDPHITVHRFYSDGDWLTAEMAAFIKAGDFDVLMIHSTHPKLLKAVELTDRPVICYANTRTEHEVGEYLDKLACLIVFTQETKDFFIKRHRVKADRVAIMPRLVDTEVFTPGVKSEGQHRLLYVGRISPGKRVWMLPEVLRRLRDRDLRYTLDLVGDYDHPSRDEPILTEAIAANRVKGSVHFSVAWTMEELAEAYQEADVLVSASVQETFCQVFLEALACGLPVVTTAGGECREWAAPYVHFTDDATVDVNELVWLIENADPLPPILREKFKQTYSWQARKAEFVGMVEGVIS